MGGYFYSGSTNSSGPTGSSSTHDHTSAMVTSGHSLSQSVSPLPPAAPAVKGPPRKQSTPSLQNQPSSGSSGPPLGPPLGPPQPPRSVSALQQQAQQSSHGSQPDYTQVSPAKLALRRHLSQERLAAASAEQLQGMFHHAYIIFGGIHFSLRVCFSLF